MGRAVSLCRSQIKRTQWYVCALISKCKKGFPTITLQRPCRSLTHILHSVHTHTHLSPTAVAQPLHDRVDLLLEDLGQLGAVFVDAGGLAVVEPGVVEHEPDVIHVLPGLLVLTRVQLSLDGRQVDRVLHNIEVVLGRKQRQKFLQVRGNVIRELFHLRSTFSLRMAEESAKVHKNMMLLAICFNSMLIRNLIVSCFL